MRRPKRCVGPLGKRPTADWPSTLELKFPRHCGASIAQAPGKNPDTLLAVFVGVEEPAGLLQVLRDNRNPGELTTGGHRICCVNATPIRRYRGPVRGFHGIDRDLVAIQSWAKAVHQCEDLRAARIAILRRALEKITAAA